MIAVGLQDNLNAGRGSSCGQFCELGLTGGVEMSFGVLYHHEVVVSDGQQRNYYGYCVARPRAV